MRPLILLSLPALLWGCLPSGDTRSPSGDATPSADLQDAADTSTACELDAHCPRLTICADGACVTRYCGPVSGDAECGQDPAYDMSRGCYLPLGVCTAPECRLAQHGRCLVLMADGVVGESDDTCVMAVCQPEPPP